MELLVPAFPPGSRAGLNAAALSKAGAGGPCASGVGRAGVPLC